MTRLKRIAFVGNSLPRQCGIATFTTDLQQAVAATALPLETTVVALTDPGREYSYPKVVGFEVQQNRLEDYVRASEFINKGGYDVMSLQHEFGIFGGEAGSHILDLLERVTIPVVTTLHTVLADPEPAQRRVLDRILALSSRVVVMAEKGRSLLLDTYDAPREKVEVIPHGIPNYPFVGPEAAKARLGFSDKTVILTFGLLSPNKGIEVMIDAMPMVLKSHPGAVYVVLGATHPNLVRDHGESYRHSLQSRVDELGLHDHVVFLDKFVDRPTLLQYIAMCDVYVTPYLNKAQMTSGTLAYSFGLGNAVVSTPYWHAVELLDHGHGLLVPFGDAEATGQTISALLMDEPRRQAMRQRAYADSRHMTWDHVAARYVTLFDRARAAERKQSPLRSTNPALPALRFNHLEIMSDDTGLIQHAIHDVPDRLHGYCVDDNARALLLASTLASEGRDSIPERMTSAYASFVQHAFNSDTDRFRNFMGYDRRWLEPQGSEDSHGRTLWALGLTARGQRQSSRSHWAAELFERALPAVENFGSPRSWAFALLGLNGYCEVRPEDGFALGLRNILADRLCALLIQVESPDWIWFEEGLAYDNARFCEALILTGRETGQPDYAQTGLRTLDWLMARQTSSAGNFRPVGSTGFGDVRQPPRAFDQQPVEASASIAACLAAWRMTTDTRWRSEANRAFAWFTGSNDLGVSLVDTATGSCRDGLHPDRPNENRGAESVLSYLLGLLDMQQFDRLALAPNPSRLAVDKPRLTLLPQPKFRGRLVASKFPEPPGPLPQA
ncbi:glycosyltransferase family 4 protein [Devosia sp. BK]|uniref:glycosyltransferase family 4 protein n=1 Tax=Devosia sp. BK TaxID=2871706 RepID=UPI0029399E5F|nr:glycosyltransferase family 4 protein [Devosia sp. BK]MDV3249746.1 glycosyltransferase family 4 protein [Devosia sp. BK]